MTAGAVHRLGPGRFAWAFVALAITSGITIGMNKILVTLLALKLDAEPWQIGLLVGAESLSMMLMSLPAGVYISRFGPSRVYLVASIGAMLLYPLVGYAGTWHLAALLLLIAGICIPFRVVSMNTSWLERLPEIGRQRAGWYRGTLMLGIGLLGPMLGNFSAERVGVHGSYWITSGLFAAMAVYGYLILSETRIEEPQQKTGDAMRGMLLNLRDPVVRQVCIFDGLGGLVRGFFGTFIIIIAIRQFGWDAQTGVTLLVIEGATFVAVLLTLGVVVNRLGEDRTYNLGHVSLLAGLLMLGLGTDFVWLAAGAVLQATGQGFNHLVNVSRLAHSGRNAGHVSGLFTMVGMAGGFAGATLGGLLGSGLLLQHIFLLWIPVWLVVCPGVRALLSGRPARA